MIVKSEILLNEEGRKDAVIKGFPGKQELLLEINISKEQFEQDKDYLSINIDGDITIKSLNYPNPVKVDGEWQEKKHYFDHVPDFDDLIAVKKILTVQFDEYLQYKSEQEEIIAQEGIEIIQASDLPVYQKKYLIDSVKSFLSVEHIKLRIKEYQKLEKAKEIIMNNPDLPEKTKKEEIKMLDNGVTGDPVDHVIYKLRVFYEHKEQERKEQEKQQWIREHGSERLKLALQNNYNCQRLYVEERAKKELEPEWIIDFYGNTRWKKRISPSLKALKLEQQLKDKGYDTEVIWMTKPPNPSESEAFYEQYDEREVIKISFLDKYLAIRNIDD